jgi:ATP-dependent DNA ligase
MYARLVNELPEGKDWLYEVKFDGYRCLAEKDATGVTLWSRRIKHSAEIALSYRSVRFQQGTQRSRQ